MSRYKTDQRYVLHRRRAFHFVSYEARHADPRTGTEAMSPTWLLMSGGKRWAAVPQIPDQDEKALITELIRWLDTHVFER